MGHSALMVSLKWKNTINISSHFKNDFMTPKMRRMESRKEGQKEGKREGGKKSIKREEGKRKK